jgi:hypothetical protein
MRANRPEFSDLRKRLFTTDLRAMGLRAKETWESALWKLRP